MRRSADAWSFPDCGAQVVMIPPRMVSAMCGDTLVVPATLQITDAGGHSLPVIGAKFISITRWDKGNCAFMTKQMAYLCEKTGDLVLSSESMTVLWMVAASIDDAESVPQISGCAIASYPW